MALTVKSRRRAASASGSDGSPVTVKPRWPRPAFDSVRGSAMSSPPSLNTAKLAPTEFTLPSRSSTPRRVSAGRP